MGDCGCGGGGGGTAAPVASSHAGARAGPGPTCPVEECGCDACVRLRIVRYLPWLSAPDVAVGAHIPGGAMVVPELPERDPDLTPPWMWTWWEDGGGTGVTAPADRGEGHASSAKVSNADGGGAVHTDADEVEVPETREEDDSVEGLDYWENKQELGDDDPRPELDVTIAGHGTNRPPGGCFNLPVTVDMWNIALLGGVCQIDFGPCPHLSSLLTGTVPSLNYTLPAGYVPTRTKKEMREFCIPEWEERRTLSWASAARLVEVGPTQKLPGLFWTEGKGFYHRALMYAVATLHGSADLVEEPTVFSSKCGLSLVGEDLLRSNIEDASFTINTYDQIKLLGCEAVTGSVTINGSGVSNHGPGALTVAIAGGSRRAFTFAGVIRLCDHKVMNAALADYYFWWAWRLYSYGMDVGDFKALVMAQLAARAALSEICEISALLVHEYTHHIAGSFEDHKEREEPTNCCHHGLDHTFRHRLLARFGCPAPVVYLSVDITVRNVVGNANGSRPRGRWDFSTGDGWAFTIGTPVDPDDSCLPFVVTADHDQFWTADHTVDVRWAFLSPKYWDWSSGAAPVDSQEFGSSGHGRSR